MPTTTPSFLARLALFTSRHRWKVIGAWVLLTVVGAVAAGQLDSRWYQRSPVPGAPAYEAGQRSLEAFGVGDRSPNVVVFRGAGDVTKQPEVRRAVERAVATEPGARSSSFFSTGDRQYVSADRHTTFAVVYPPGPAGFDVLSGAERMRAAAQAGLPAGISVDVTGRDALGEASKEQSGGGNASLAVEALIGGVGALIVLLFVFGTLPAVLMPLAVAVAAILNTFSLVWVLTHVTSVSIIVQFLIALVGLGIAIDYALLMIMRFRDELHAGRDVESALVATMTRAGRSVIVSGTTVAIGLLAIAALPLPLVRSMGIGGMLIPAVSVLASRRSSAPCSSPP